MGPGVATGDHAGNQHQRLGLDLNLFNREEYEEVLAAADGVDPDLGEDLPLDQLDWMKASEGWFLTGLAGRVPVAVYEAVQMARPRAALRTIKFLVETEGKTFQIKMS
ncbi:hypothetical protein ACLKA7_000125 [Drosophila subpalustris]